MRSPGSIPTAGNILSLDFLFSCSKASDANIGIIAILVHFEKTLTVTSFPSTVGLATSCSHGL